MNKNILFAISLVVLVIGAGTLLFSRSPKVEAPTGEMAGEDMTIDQTITDGTITFAYSSRKLELAVTPEQVSARSYIPPCSPDFAYCLYLGSDEYKGTNFESAGLRIQKRADLSKSRECMETLPEGYAGLTPLVLPSTRYTTSVFAPLGDAAAGHYASGALYRLFSGSSCYEFETRIGETQYANYPEGTIKKFTDTDHTAVEAKLSAVLKTVTLPSGERVSFPAAPRAAR